MHDQVRVTPNRRSEVRVVLRGETEVTETHRVVPRLLHRAEHDRRNRTLLRRSTDAVNQLLKVPRRHGSPRGAKSVPKRLDERLELSDLLDVRRFVYAGERLDAGLDVGARA